MDSPRSRGGCSLRRLLPLLAGAQALGVVLADRGLLDVDAALVLAATSVALGFALRPAPRARVLLALLVAMAAGAGALGRRIDDAERWSANRVREVDVEGTVREVARGSRGWRVELEDVTGVTAAAPWPPPRLRLFGRPTPPGLPALEAGLPGDRLRARLRLRSPRGLRNPGAPDREGSARREGVAAIGRLVHPALHARIPERDPWRPLAPWYRARARLARRLAEAGPGGALLRALALGDRAELPAPAREAFARLGIAHLLAVSGLHLGLVASLVYAGASLGPGRLVWITARWDRRGPALAAGVGAAAAYAVLAGWGVPVRRALVLLLALALGFARGRPGLRLQALSLAAVVILACEPEALFAPGAQLSFAASAALALALPRAGPARSAAGARLSDALRLSASALSVTAPIAALHLGNRAPFALFANLVAVPWTGLVLLPASLVATAAAAIGGAAARLVLATAERLAAGTLGAASLAAERVPGAVDRGPPAWPWLVAAGLLAAFVLTARWTPLRLALAVAISALLWVAPPARLLPEPPRAVFLDVGQGDATLVQGRRAVVLVDAGVSVPGGPDLGRSAVVPALRALGVTRLDLVIATHADLDHRGGIPAVLEAFPVGRVWLPRGGRGEPGFAAVREAARARGVPLLERGRADGTHRVGDLAITPLWPPVAGDSLSPNDRSLVVRIEAGGRRLLLPGDVELDAEAALLASPAELRADVLKLPHHGSRSSSSPGFLAAVGASVAVASAPCAGRFGMPGPEVRERAREAGVSVWWTGRDGAVRIGLGRSLRVRGTGPPRVCPVAESP